MAETTSQQHSAHGHSSQQDAILTVSDVERLQAIDFEAMSAAQIARARAEILRARRLFGLRRTCPAARGASSDDTLAQFNRRWAKRILGQGAMVLLVTDELDRAEADGLAPAMKQLYRFCRRLIWFTHCCAGTGPSQNPKAPAPCRRTWTSFGPSTPSRASVP